MFFFDFFSRKPFPATFTTNTYGLIDAYTYVCTDVCMYICMCAHMSVCAFVIIKLTVLQIAVCKKIDDSGY